MSRNFKTITACGSSRSATFYSLCRALTSLLEAHPVNVLSRLYDWLWQHAGESERRDLLFLRDLRHRLISPCTQPVCRSGRVASEPAAPADASPATSQFRSPGKTNKLKSILKKRNFYFDGALNVLPAGGLGNRLTSP